MGQPGVNLGVSLRGVNLGSTWGQPWVNLGSTWGQPGVNFLCPTLAGVRSNIHHRRQIGKDGTLRTLIDDEA